MAPLNERSGLIMKRIFGCLMLALLVAPIACSSGDDGDAEGNACERACQKLEGCSPGSTCTIDGNDCSGQAKDIADCINSASCDETNQCLFGGSGGSGGAGSGGSGGSGGGSCADIAGTYSVSGTCGVDDCVITQSGCSVNFECDDGSASYTGTVTASTVSFSGVTGTCQGAVSGGTLTGTCTGALGACTFSASK
jgi:hypothetical protein